MGKKHVIIEIMILGGWWYLTSLLAQPQWFFLNINDPMHVLGIAGMFIMGLIIPDQF